MQLARFVPTGLTAVIAACVWSDGAVAQKSAPPSHWEFVSVVSGTHANPSPVEGVVWRGLVTLPEGTPWLRLYYNDVHLEKGSYLRIVSLRDGDVMTMRQEHMPQWGFSSAYFNGNAVMVELVAGANTQKNWVEITKVMAGDTSPAIPQPESICGATDDRVPSSDARVGRIDPIGCTGWLIDLPTTGVDKCHLSAGHCFATGQILEFAVPGSATSCALVHPPVAKQFAIDSSSSQQVNGGVGNDYWVYRCFPNPTTGRTTFQEQGAAFTLAAAIPGTGTTLRNYGFGVDGTATNNAGGGNASCGCAGPNGARNQTQQTHTGPLNSVAGNALNYGFDTCGGNSGSVVLSEATGQAIGIHTHGGCDSFGSNSGTAITHAGLQAAIAVVCQGGAGHANDECSTAALVVAGTNGPFDNSTAAVSSPAWPCGLNVNRDIWFVINACGGSYTFTTCTAARSVDTVMELFSGSCAGLTSLACNDDTGGTCGFGSTITATLAAGTYYLRVGGYNGGSGSFELVVSAPCHGNDECTGALPLNNGVNGPFDNNTASTSAPAWPCGGGGADCWFYYDVTCTNLAYTFATCENVATYDTVLEVLSGACGNLVSLGCNDDACGPTFRQSSMTVTPPVGRLYIRVGGFFGSRGTFNLTVTPTPLNEECATAIAVANGANGPFCNLGSSTSAPAWPCGAGGNDVWFAYTATCTGNLVASTCAGTRTFDTALEAFAGGCGGLTSLGCNDDAGGACGLGSTLSVPVQAGQTYFIRLGGFGGSFGQTDLQIDCIHPTDECVNAAAIGTGVNGPFSTQFATTSAPAWPCGGGGNDCWFVFVPGCTAPHTFSTCTANRTFDTTLEIFDGSCAALNALGCNDDAGGACGLGSALTVSMVAGTPCFLRVGGFGGQTGTFDLTAIVGTGTGSISQSGPGCGPTTISVTGSPAIGGAITTQLGSVVGAPFIGLGFNVTNSPFCGCVIGHDWAAANFGTTHVLNVPCDPVFIGSQVGIQGADFFGVGGCPAPRLTLTSTWRVVIG